MYIHIDIDMQADMGVDIHISRDMDIFYVYTIHI